MPGVVQAHDRRVARHHVSLERARHSAWPQRRSAGLGEGEVVVVFVVVVVPSELGAFQAWCALWAMSASCAGWIAAPTADPAETWVA